MTTNGSARPLRAGRREWIGLAVLVLPTMVTTLDISVLFVALPRLTADLAATATQQLWITDSYGFLVAGFLVTMGTLGDRLGRRRVLVLGGLAFAVLSLVAAYASSAGTLIVARGLLGIAGATIMPSTLALIIGMFQDPRERGAAISVWASALTGGVALGPIVGGLLLEWYWWGSAFLVAVPVMLALAVLGPLVLPQVKNPGAARLDLASVVLSLGALLPFVYGLKDLARTGWHAGPVAIALVGIIFAIAFVNRQRSLANPLLDLGLFALPAVGGALALSFLVAAIQGGSGFFVAQYLQSVGGLTPLRTGLWMLVPTCALIAGIFVSQAVAREVRPAHVLAAGTLLAACGMIVLTSINATTELGILLIGFTMVYIGVSPVGPLISQLVVPAAPPERAGSAASLQSTSGELGVALGIAVLGSIGVATYRSEIWIPADIVATPQGQRAGETIAGALDVAPSLPPGLADGLVASARMAFTSGLNVAATISAVVFVGLAGLALATLRRLPALAVPGSPPPQEQADPTLLAANGAATQAGGAR